MNADGGVHGGVSNDFGAGGDPELENILRIFFLWKRKKQENKREKKKKIKR